jgi:hypothetical protein
MSQRVADFITRTLAQVDDLAELKVSLVALALLDQKFAPAPFVTEDELMAHPAICEGLSFPAISLRPALQRAVARGTLLCVEDGKRRYFANDDAGRRAVEAIANATAQFAGPSQAVLNLLIQVGREIERLEGLEVYQPEPDDPALLEEFLARGYTEAEILAGVREALRELRPPGAPPRTLRFCLQWLEAQPPATPSAYYRAVVAGTSPLPEEVLCLREWLGRLPNGREYQVVHDAIGLFGMRAVCQALRRLPPTSGVEALFPLLFEQEEAALAMLRRSSSGAEDVVRTLIALYESSFGLPPTSTIVEEMQALWAEVNDLDLWQNVFRYAAERNKRSWPYVKKLLRQPSPDLFVPSPVNEAARFAFEEYKRRVNRTLDSHVAAQINALAAHITDPARWRAAFDKAAAANALRWDYISAVLADASPAQREKGSRDGKRTSKTTQRERTFRRRQVEYTDEQRAAIEERDRQLLEAERRAQGGIYLPQ